jgi:hypothetical protein
MAKYSEVIEQLSRQISALARSILEDRGLRHSDSLRSKTQIVQYRRHPANATTLAG